VIVVRCTRLARTATHDLNVTKRPAKRRHKRADGDEVTATDFARNYFGPVIDSIRHMSAEFGTMLRRSDDPPPDDLQMHIVRLWAGYLGGLIATVHEAAMDLTVSKCSVAADILIRQLFEYFVKLHYLVGNPEEAEFQFNRGRLDFLKAIPEPDRQDDQKVDIQQLEALLATHGKRRPKSVEEMTKDLERRGPDGEIADGISMYDSEYRTRSQLVHGTGRGMGLVMNTIRRRQTHKTALLEMYHELSISGHYLGLVGWIVAGVQGAPKERWGSYSINCTKPRNAANGLSRKCTTITD
jgi:hypothetical protein